GRERRLVRIGEAAHLDEAADQRIAIGVRARRSEPEDHIARTHIGFGQYPLALDGADREAREIIVAAMIHAGHLGGFPAYEGAARLPAALGDAGDDIARFADLKFAGGEVI